MRLSVDFHIKGEICLSLLILLFLPSPNDAENNLEKKKYEKTEISSVENYYRLKKAYTLWHEGLFGSRKYNEYELLDLLESLRGKQITTPAEFILLVPESITRPQVTCRFKTCRWLKLKGEIDGEALQPFLKRDPELLRKWWRTRKLFSITGRIKKFRLTRDAGGDIIELWLDKIVPFSSPKKTEGGL